MGNMKKIVIKYFEGCSTEEEEKEIFSFVHANPENQELFEHWEREWLDTFKDSQEAEQDWESFVEKNTEFKKESLAKKFAIGKLFKRYAMVAAACLLMGMCLNYLILRVIREGASENIFMVEVPSGEKSKVILPDGTIVWLNADSKLSYSADFNAKHRTVQLLGEGYFEVSKREKQPFVVKTSRYDIVVKGTKFNISSYEADKYITTSLMEGEVELLYKNELFRMKPGEIVQLDTKKDVLIKTNGRIGQFKSWTENKIEYDAITLYDLVLRLERQYNVTIHLEASDLKNKVLSVSLNNKETIEEIMQGITKIVPVSIKYQGEDICIRNK